MPLDNDGPAEHIGQRRGQAEQQTGGNRMHADSQAYQVGREVSNSQDLGLSLLSTEDRHVLHQLVADLDAVVPDRFTHCLVVTDSKQGGSSVTQEEERVKGPGIFLRLA